jgi:hypothetical protein
MFVTVGRIDHVDGTGGRKGRRREINQFTIRGKLQIFKAGYNILNILSVVRTQ